MLFLIEYRFATENLLDSLCCSDTNTVLISPSDAVSNKWQVYGREDPTSLGDWWKELIRPPPADNRLLIIWGDPDQHLTNLLQFIQRQDDEYRLSVSALLAGPLSVQSSLDTVLSPQSSRTNERLINTVWYIGNEDIARQQVSEDIRRKVIEDIIRVLTVANDTITNENKMRLYPDNVSLPPFTAFGFKSWRPPTDNVKMVIKYASAIALRDELTLEHASFPEWERTFLAEAGSAFSALRVLNTPYSRNDSSESSVPFPQKLSSPPDNPFRNWICPLLREHAVIEGKRRIDERRMSSMDYYKCLRSELLKFANAIRQNGQKIFESIMQSCRTFVSLSPSMARIKALLGVYFPAVSKRQVAGVLTPCQSDSSPSPTNCEQWFIKDAKAELEKNCDYLPRIKNALTIGGIVLVLFLLSLGFHSFHFASNLVWAPILAALLLTVVFICWCAYLARRVTNAMIDYFDKKYQELRDAYVVKLEWVVDKTQIMLERQITSGTLAIGRKLHKNFEDMFTDWEKQADESSEAKLEKLLADMELSRADKESLKKQVQESALELIEDATREAPPLAGKEKFQELSKRFAKDLIAKVNQKIVPPDKVEAMVLKCVSRDNPPVLARLDGSQLQDDKTYKVFMFPGTYPAWEDDFSSKGRRSMLDIKCWRGAVNAPAIFTARSHLTIDEMKRTLVVTEVK